MRNSSTPDFDDLAPSTAVVERVMAAAAEVVIVESSPDELDGDAARTVVSGDEIAELARLLAVVDGGNGDHCLCVGWPTICVFDAAGRELARWTLHHQTGIRGLGRCDADLRDGPGLTRWLADHGLTGSREAQEMLARRQAEAEERRARWVSVAPAVLADAAEAASRRVDGAEELLADLVVAQFPDTSERIQTLVAWAGFPARQTDGTPWYELAPQRMLLAESNESIFAALDSTFLTLEQLDGAAELFTSLDWTRPLRAEVPEPLRTRLITHVTATGTDPMKFRMRHGYGASRG